MAAESESGTDAATGDGPRALAETLLAEVREELDRADSKASLLIGGLGIAITILVSGLIGGEWTPERLDAPATVLQVLSALCAGGSVVAAALAVWPRMTKPPADGVITFWGHIRDFRSPADVAEALETRALRNPERVYQQLMVLSAVVRRKYSWIRWSMVLAAAAGVTIFLAYVIDR